MIWTGRWRTRGRLEVGCGGSEGRWRVGLRVLLGGWLRRCLFPSITLLGLRDEVEVLTNVAIAFEQVGLDTVIEGILQNLKTSLGELEEALKLKVTGDDAKELLQGLNKIEQD